MTDSRRGRAAAGPGAAAATAFRWSGARRARPDDDGRLVMELRLAEGEHHDLILEISDQPIDDAPPDPATAWQATEEAWSAVVPGLR